MSWEPFIDMAMQYLMRQPDHLQSEFDLGSWPRYDYDQDAGTLTFSSNGRIGVVADIHIVGSTAKRSGTWLWAWDNPSILEHVKHCLADVRAYGEAHGLDKLTTAKWPGDEHDGWEMTAATAFILRAEGAQHRVVIRVAKREDVPAIRRLMEAEPGFWHPDWSDATLAKGIESAGDLALVWEEGNSIAGFVCTHDFGFRAYLSELIVAQGARGRGIGRSLVERVQTELAGRGRRVLIADVWHSAEAFYRSLGWQPPDVVLLRRKLDPARAV